MKKYFIELVQGIGDRVEPVERYEASTESQAVAIFEKLVKKAREEKAGTSVRIFYGWSYDSSDFVEDWCRW